jgi:hypothetical protein
MGIFDYVFLEIPLPDGFEQYQGDDFQTKSLPDRYMRELYVKDDGKLYVKEWEYRDVTEEEVQEHKLKYAGTVVEDFPPVVKRTGNYEWKVIDDVHLDLEIYDRFDHDGNYIDVTIRFTNGVIQSVTASKYKKGEWGTPVETSRYDWPPPNFIQA